MQRAGPLTPACPPHLLEIFLTLGLGVASLASPLFSLAATFSTPQGASWLRAACLVITLTAPEGRPC